MSTADLATLERIDVHSHAITPEYRKFLVQTGHENPDGWPEIPVRHLKFPMTGNSRLTFVRNGHQKSISR